MAGEYCSESNPCAEGDCELPLNDDTPGGLVCTIACEPGGSPCPIGTQGQPLTCQRTATGYRCHYPGEVPGSVDAACDPLAADPMCHFGPCDGIDNSSGGVCREACTGTCTDPAEVCGPWSEDRSIDVCQPPLPEGGACAAAPLPDGAVWLVLVAIATLWLSSRPCSPR